MANVLVLPDDYQDVINEFAAPKWMGDVVLDHFTGDGKIYDKLMRGLSDVVDLEVEVEDPDGERIFSMAQFNLYPNFKRGILDVNVNSRGFGDCSERFDFSEDTSETEFNANVYNAVFECLLALVKPVVQNIMGIEAEESVSEAGFLEVAQEMADIFEGASDLPMDELDWDALEDDAIRLVDAVHDDYYIDSTLNILEYIRRKDIDSALDDTLEIIRLLTEG